MDKVEMYFRTGCAVGQGPGKALDVRAGDVVAVDAATAAALRRSGMAVPATESHADAPRTQRLHPDDVALRISPRLDQATLEIERKRRINAALLDRQAAQLRSEGVEI